MKPLDCRDFTRDGVSRPLMPASSDIVISKLLFCASRAIAFEKVRRGPRPHARNRHDKRDAASMIWRCKYVSTVNIKLICKILELRMAQEGLKGGVEARRNERGDLGDE